MDAGPLDYKITKAIFFFNVMNRPADGPEDNLPFYRRSSSIFTAKSLQQTLCYMGNNKRTVLHFFPNKIFGNNQVLKIQASPVIACITEMISESG